MIIHIIVSTLVVPANVKPHNNYIWTRAYYLLQDIEQPLWWKSLAIQLSQPEGSPIRRLILRLGAFHMYMNFLGSIGHLMAGSGIKELFEMIYAPKAVE